MSWVVRCKATRVSVTYNPAKTQGAHLLAAQQMGEVGRAGGCRGHPNRLASVDRYRPTWRDARKCKRCRNVAVHGQDQCTLHLGRWSPLSPAAGRAESRTLARLERAGRLPLELIALPVWRGLNGIQTSKRAPQRLALVRAWDQRYRAPLCWAQSQRQAIDLAGQVTRRQHTAFWYENR